MKLKSVIFLCLLFLASVPVIAQEAVETVSDNGNVAALRPPAPVSMLRAQDSENDHGHAVMLSWETSADDGQGAGTVISYEVFRWVPFMRDSIETVRKKLVYYERGIDNVQAFIIDSLSSFDAALAKIDSLLLMPDSVNVDSLNAESALLSSGKEKLSQMKTGDVYQEAKSQRNELRKQYNLLLEKYPEFYSLYPQDGKWRKVGVAPAGSTTFEDKGSKEREASDYLPDFCNFYYRIDALTADESVRSESEIVGPVQSYGQWFNTGRVPIAAAVLIFGILTSIFVQRARSGADLYVRPLAGIEAVDDAIGRATEMGKPILYVLGLGTASDVATIASFTILGRVAKKVAEYQTALIVPTYDPIVMTVAQEVVKSSYFDAGRPDDYKEDTVHFVTQSQFAYVAAVNGTMLRELPATNVYMGKFYAESLLLAETGAVAGSIQIAGTDEIAQIPFFIVACDYTLIGEELYAASAYLGREPILLGSLKAQDWAKAAMILLGIIGLIAANFDWTELTRLFHVAN